MGKKIHGSIENKDVEKKYKDCLISALKDVDWQTQQRKLMIPWAKNKFSWNSIARDWSNEFDY